MRFVVRPADSEPDALSNPGVAIRRERKAAACFYFRADLTHPNYAGFKFKEYNQRPVKLALAVMFGAKCAYCERDIRSGADAEIEHYRPKAAVEGEVHPGYWWLAHSWSNMLYSCKACNQRRRVIVLDDYVTPEEFERLLNKPAATSHGKQNYFPVAGVRAMHRKDDHAAEQPLLIDPTVTDPALHLDWSHDGPQSMVRAREANGVRDLRGAESIKGYALNRVPLIARRNATLKILRVQRTRILAALQKSLGKGAAPDAAVEEASRDAEFLRHNYDDDQEFTAMSRGFVERFEQELAAMKLAGDD
jgi:uncharacterized protein (TIGR02646 family)